MQRGTVQALAVLTAYMMLIVLVCPSIPTPTYVYKQNTFDHHAALLAPVLCPLAPVAAVRRIALVVAEIVQQRPADLVELICQRLC